MHFILQLPDLTLGQVENSTILKLTWGGVKNGWWVVNTDVCSGKTRVNVVLSKGAQTESLY